jgi:4-hydroxythreonine-4-phosphate dehydrogenase
VALMLGDRYGVGPELVAKLAETYLPPENLGVVVCGDPEVWTAGRRVAGGAKPVPEAGAFVEAMVGWSFLPMPARLPIAPMGQLSAAAGREVLSTLDRLATAAKSGQIHGIVYAPLNKQAMKLAGHEAGDELEFFARALPASGAVGEINILGELWTSRVTSHVPLRAVGDLITRASVRRGIELLATALRQSGRNNPRLAVAALNPHAGEGGAFGQEEIDVIAPAIAEAKAAGIEAAGPFPADTVFPRAIGGAFDGVVTMFHDQGQIALKMVGLGKGITLLAGFPVPIATPGHGTAYDIAGKGMARVDGLAAAVVLVAAMARFDPAAERHQNEKNAGTIGGAHR